MNNLFATSPIMQEQPGYADSGQIMSVEFDKKIIIYWWLMANLGLLTSFIGIPLMLIWLPFGWIVHQKQYEHMSGALTTRSLNMRMGWLFKKQQNIALDKLTDVSISEGPVLKALGVVKMQFETAGAAPFILSGVKNADQFRDVVLQHRDSLMATPSPQSNPTTESNEVLIEIRDLLKEINTNLSSEE